MKIPPALVGLVALTLASLRAQTATTLNLSTDLVRLGIASSNMTPNQPTLESGALLEAAVRYAVQNRLTRIVADTGSYYFTPRTPTGAHAAFAGPAVTAPALTIDLQGSDLYLATQGSIGIFVTGGANLTLQNCSIDYQQMNFTQVLVTSVNSAQRQFQFTVQPGWQNPSALNALIPTGQAIAYVYVFRNGQPWASYSRMPAQSPYSDNAVTLTAATATSAIAAIRPGDVAVLEARTGGNAVLATNLSGLTLRNIKIYSGGSGVRLVRCSSSLLERVAVMPRPGTDRLMSTVADGIQPQQLGTDNTIRLCRTIRTGDDGISPVTFAFGSVQSISGARSVQVQGDAATALNSNFPLPNGSNVAFERATDGVVVASAVLVSQATAATVGGLPQTVLTFDRDLPATVAGTWVYSTDASWRGGNTLLERNTVQQQTSFRGFSIWGLMDSKIAGNYIHRSSSAGIDIVHQLRVGDWIVPPTVNLVVTNNVIDGTNTSGGQNDPITLAGIEILATTPTTTPMSASPHQNISLTSNFIANPGRSALWIGHTAGAQIDDNYLFNPNDIPSLALGFGSISTATQALQPIVVQNSLNVSLGANPIDKASGRAFVTDPGFRELAAYAPGSTLRLNAYNLGLVTDPTFVLTDADGKLWGLTVTATSTHAIDVQLPAGMGLGGAVVTLKSGGISYLGTLFVDSQDNIPVLNQATTLISPGTTNVAADGGTISLLVVTQPGATYQASTTSAFVTANASGTGAGMITVSVARNTGAARTATIEIAGQPIAITQSGASDPVIVTQPQSQAVKSGETATYTVSATGAQSYQWAFNGAAIAGATGASFTVGNVSGANTGTYTVAARNASGTTTSAGALLVFKREPPTLPNISRLVNLSILTNITATDPLFTLGTSIGGSGTSGGKALLIRVAGPALAAFGVSGPISDPKFDVFSGQTIIATNDNWGGTPALSDAFTAVGAFGYLAPSSRDAAALNPAMAAGGYTIQVSGVGGATGAVIAELYDSTPESQFTALTPRLINVSVLKQIATGETLTAGFVIGGSATKQVLLRVVGPALGLAPFNIPGAMADPKLELFSGSTVVASNDNWGTPVGSSAATAAQLTAAFNQVGAFVLPAGSRDAVVLATLAPGAYTAQATAIGAGGQAIVEVYEVP